MALREHDSEVTSETQFPNEKFHQGSLNDESDRQLAITQIHQGGLIASTLRTYGVWFDGQNESALENSFLVKNEERKPDAARSIMGFIPKFIRFVDTNAIHPDLQEMILDAEKFQQRVGAMTFLRLPLKPEALRVIPQALRTRGSDNRDYMHLLDPTGHAGMTSFIEELNASGVEFVGVTSLNKKNQPEIQNLADAVAFCRQETDKIGMLLSDESQTNYDFIGSFAIIDFVSKSLVRGGQIQHTLLEKIYGTTIDKTNAKPAKFENPDHITKKVLEEYGLSGEGIRAFILAYTNGDVQLK